MENLVSRILDEQEFLRGIYSLKKNQSNAAITAKDAINAVLPDKVEEKWDVNLKKYVYVYAGRENILLEISRLHGEIARLRQENENLKNSNTKLASEISILQASENTLRACIEALQAKLSVWTCNQTGGRKTARRTLKNATRVDELRNMGVSLRKIAKKLSIPVSAVRACIKYTKKQAAVKAGGEGE